MMQQNPQTPKQGKTVNNKFQGCPAMMSDGRIFTDYRPATYVNDMIRFANGIHSSYDYRQFLMHNARNIMDVNSQYTASKLSCQGVAPVDIPTQSVCAVTLEGIKCQTTNPNGFGMRVDVPPNTVPQLGMEGNIRGAMDRGAGHSAPLNPQFDYHCYARF